MGKKASKEHDAVLEYYAGLAKSQGRRVINLNDKSPDAIEAYIEDGKIVLNVIDVMHVSATNTAKLSYLARDKKELYGGLGFDEVKIYQYNPEEKTTQKGLKRIPLLDGFGYTCRKCGMGFNGVSEFNSHIYHEHTKKDPKNKLHYKPTSHQIGEKKL